MTLKEVMELGDKNYNLLSDESKMIHTFLTSMKTLGMLSDKMLNGDVSDSIFKNMKYKPKNDVIKCSDLTELDGTKCGEFTLEVLKNESDISVSVFSYFEGQESYITVYENKISKDNTPKKIIKDLKTFGFNIELEDKIQTITYKDKETGKIVGIITYNSKERLETKLGKYKYVHLADMFKELDKNIEEFNDILSYMFKDLEIIHS